MFVLLCMFTQQTFPSQTIFGKKASVVPLSFPMLSIRGQALIWEQSFICLKKYAVLHTTHTYIRQNIEIGCEHSI